MKKARNPEEAWKIVEKYEGQPHGWIQWKGTEVCMDVHCECGYHGHIDADFAYHVKCPKCHRVYTCSGYIELVEISEEPEQCVIEMEEDEEDLRDLLSN